MRAALDANCFIDATNPISQNHSALQIILSGFHIKQIELFISRHTLAELEKKPDSALELARIIPILPHWPIGTWDDQVANWAQVQGTWDDAERNQQLQEEIEQLANSGNDIRDRGAYLDALYSGMDVFVTSDMQLVGSGPAKRLEERFGLRVITSIQFAEQLRKQRIARKTISTQNKDNMQELYLEHLRHQELVVHRWIKFWITIQSAFFLALAFFIKLQAPLGAEVWLYLHQVMPFGIIILGLTTNNILLRIILRERWWQQEFSEKVRQIQQIQEVPQEIRLFSEPRSENTDEGRGIPRGWIFVWYHKSFGTISRYICFGGHLLALTWLGLSGVLISSYDLKPILPYLYNSIYVLAILVIGLADNIKHRDKAKNRKKGGKNLHPSKK